MGAAAPSLVDQLIAEQRTLTAVEQFSRVHAQTDRRTAGERYRELLPATALRSGERLAFEVDLDACTGCKACVTACHNLNGLDADETWRRVGTLVGDGAVSVQRQVVTTACHHCEDPGCLKGCPVMAYEQDSATGIVRHLDDQCIGCQYCVLMCPYEVPQYSPSRGIVRKCDMCQNRLAIGEAPACVQGCPNEAIAIRAVPVGGVGFQLPGAPDPAITRPSTRYVTERSDVLRMHAVGAPLETPAHAHWPLVWMLTCTQAAVGILGATLLVGDLLRLLPTATRIGSVVAGWTLLAAGLAASLTHLGRPAKAWRAVLGVRTSWLSREVVAFGGCFAAATGYLGATILEARLAPVAGALTVGIGLASVACSVMVYHATGRSVWTWPRVSLWFGGGTALSGLVAIVAVLAFAEPTPVFAPAVFGGAALWAGLIPLLTALDLVSAARTDTTLTRVVALLAGRLRGWAMVRVGCGLSAALIPPIVAMSALPFGAAVAVAIGLTGLALLTERYLFFAAAITPRMPSEG